jgi:hypothetical protein
MAAFLGLAAGCAMLPALAGGLSPGNGGPIILPSVLPPSVRDTMSSMRSSSTFDALGEKFGVQAGRLDFFSMRPADGGEFKPLLRAGVGDGGLRLQLKW